MGCLVFSTQLAVFKPANWCDYPEYRVRGTE